MTAAAVETARDYYNSEDADRFYQLVWGGEDIHIGLYQSDDESIVDASRRTVREMAARLPFEGAERSVLDLGSGYCGAARYLAREHGAQVTALNLSEVENERARRLNREAGLDARIDVRDGSFESVPFDDGRFDFVWSQDAILHSERRAQVLAEAFRVLKPGGLFTFTDPMQANDCPDGVLDPILKRIHLTSLGSESFYRAAGQEAGFADIRFDDRTEELPRHYARVLQETYARADELSGQISPEYLKRMRAGLQHWIDGGQEGYLAWGIFLLRKP